MPGFFYTQREFAYDRYKDEYPREYSAWAHMHQRRKHKGYKVSEQWKIFARFLEDMGTAPNKDCYLKRIDGTKPFAPDNCKWEPYSEEYIQEQKVRLEKHKETIAKKQLEKIKENREKLIAMRRKKSLNQRLGWLKLRRKPPIEL